MTGVGSKMKYFATQIEEVEVGAQVGVVGIHFLHHHYIQRLLQLLLQMIPLGKDRDNLKIIIIKN